LQALIIDSWFDSYAGVVSLVRVVNGVVRKGARIVVHSTQRKYEVERLGVFTPRTAPRDELKAGEVGFLLAAIREINAAPVGDTIVDANVPDVPALPGFAKIQPRVFAGMFPVDSDEYGNFREALQKLALNDSSLAFEPEVSAALGFGMRCGFLGLLHMEIVQERLEREHNLEIITTVPNVRYEVVKLDGTVVDVENPAALPSANAITEIREPILSAQVLVPAEYIGAVMQLFNERRGVYQNTEYLNASRALLHYELPLAEIVTDFYDRLKSVSRGYASFDYEPKTMRAADLVKLDILINGDPTDALSAIIHRDKAYDWGRELCHRLKNLIPRQMFEVIIQAAVGSRIIAREVVRAFRKNVVAKCYGGDITRKRKLLSRQKEGKKRMKQVGKVEIPQEAFLAALKIET